MADGLDNNGVIQFSDLNDKKVRIVHNVMLTAGLIIAFFFFFLFVYLILSCFKDVREFMTEATIFPKSYDFRKFVVTWNSLNYLHYFRNSLISVVGSVFCAVFFNGLLGYALSKIRPKGSALVFALVMWCLLIPSTTSIVPLFVNIARLNLTGTFIPLWLSVGANAFFVIMFKNFFDDLPDSLIEAAMIDGLNNFSIFTRIAIPLSRAIIIVIIIFAINNAWSDFLLPYLTLRGSDFETVMVRLFNFRNSASTEVVILQAVLFSIIPPVILFLFFQKQITQISIAGGIKG
jgi:multiple sugar transport system permease protein